MFSRHAAPRDQPISGGSNTVTTDNMMRRPPRVPTLPAKRPAAGAHLLRSRVDPEAEEPVQGPAAYVERRHTGGDEHHRAFGSGYVGLGKIRN